MKKTILRSKIAYLFFGLVLIVTVLLSACASNVMSNSVLTDKEYHLGAEPSQQKQYYIMRSEMKAFSQSGELEGTDTYTLHLTCTPALKDGISTFEYTCFRMAIKDSDGTETTIPGLDNWSYIADPVGIDKDNNVFGIDAGFFQTLTDSDGNVLTFDKAYHVYNTFIDYQSFCFVFGAPHPNYNGIQNLTTVGQKIIHGAANSKAPVHLGTTIKEGSYFQNGEITLVFKGLSEVNDKSCVLLEVDSGDSSFNMVLQPAPNVEVVVKGYSHYNADIYKDIETSWVQKVEFTEMVIAETALPGPEQQKMHSVVERNILIENVSEKEFNSR